MSDTTPYRHHIRYVIVLCSRCGYAISIPYEWALRNPSAVFQCKGFIGQERCTASISAPELLSKMRSTGDVITIS